MTTDLQACLHVLDTLPGKHLSIKQLDTLIDEKRAELKLKR